MIRLPTSTGAQKQGVSLLELLIALALAGMLILGLVQIVSAASTSNLLQDNQAQLQDQARFAANLLSAGVRRAGFTPQPWNEEFAIEAVGDESLDGVSATSDRLALRDWSDRNCFENRNPDQDGTGRPRFYLREQVFDLNSEASLTRTCRYGPSDSSLVTQVRRQATVPGVEAFQVLYGDDADGDGNVERWVRAPQWSGQRRVLGVRIGLLVAAADRVREPQLHRYQVLDQSVSAAADGRLRKSVELTLALRGRTP